MPSWVSSNSTNGLTQRIYELIEWYEQNFTKKEDDYIKANLQLIITLAKNVNNSDDIIFIERIIDTFCDIVRKQREIIQTIECQSQTQPVGNVIAQNDFATSYIPTVSGFTNDEQIRAVLSAYMQKEGKSSFTANDYILRVQNLWRSFYSDYQAGELPSELAESVIEEEIKADAPLLNAYNYIEELNCYVSMKMAGSGGDRNFANTRAAFNTFSKALCGDNYEKAKSERKEPITKDFSKYMFNGRTYGKSRLVLAVVKQYVEDCHPTTFEKLELAFPGDLQGSLGVVKLIDSVSDKYKGIGGVKRYFVKEDEIIRLESGEIVLVCTQWGTNIDGFIKHITRVTGYRIEKV